MSCFVVVYFQAEAQFSLLLHVSQVHVCLHFYKSKFQKDYLQQTISERFRFQSASFVYMKVNESHPMHGAVIFRINGKWSAVFSLGFWEGQGVF